MPLAKDVVNYSLDDKGLAWHYEVADHHRRINTAYICPVCGNVWGRRWTVPNARAKRVMRWQAEGRKCLRHGGGSLLPQTAWTAHIDYLLRLPRKLIINELLAAKVD